VVTDSVASGSASAVPAARPPIFRLAAVVNATAYGTRERLAARRARSG
jgi:hypothetical protein